jgi:hypothetical protein
MFFQQQKHLLTSCITCGFFIANLIVFYTFMQMFCTTWRCNQKSNYKQDLVKEYSPNLYVYTYTW